MDVIEDHAFLSLTGLKLIDSATLDKNSYLVLHLTTFYNIFPTTTAAKTSLRFQASQSPLLLSILSIEAFDGLRGHLTGSRCLKKRT